MDCLFCKIANKEQDTEIVYEDDNFVAFNDIHPKSPVHILVVPKRHIESVMALEDSDKELMGELILTAKNIAKELKGYKLLINVGRQGGQIIDHLHLHLLGMK